MAIIAKVEPQRLLFRAGPFLGEQEPLHATALGKVLISELDEDELIQIFKSDNLAKYTNNTIDTYDKLLASLVQVREQGYAVDEEEHCLGLSCIAMPIYNYDNKIVASLSISGPSFRFNHSKIMQIKHDQLKACQSISKYFGSIKSI